MQLLFVSLCHVNMTEPKFERIFIYLFSITQVLLAFGCQVLASCMGTPKMALQLLHNGMAKQIVAGLEKHGSKVSCGDVCRGAYAFNIPGTACDT